MVLHLPAPNLLMNLLPYLLQGLQIFPIESQRNLILLSSGQIILHPLHRRQRAFRLLQLLRPQHIPLFRHQQNLFHPLQGYQRRRTEFLQKLTALRGLPQGRLELSLRQDGPGLLYFGPGGGGQCQSCPDFLYFFQF